MSDKKAFEFKLSECIKELRADRPSEWLMDEFMMAAEKLEATIDRQQAALDAVRTGVAGLRRNSVWGPTGRLVIVKAVWASDLETMIEEALGKAGGES